MDWSVVRRLWEKWAPNNVGYSGGHPLKAALLINYDPSGPSRLLSTMCFSARPAPFEGSPGWIVQLGRLPRAPLPHYLVTSIHESWFCARCLNTPKQAGEGAIVMLTSAFVLVGLYEGSVGSASRAMVAVDQLSGQLSRRNL
ncbi:hypothetical protein PHJA_002485100 [Phtheirospermum japonicum]|uniref:Uncharacterized protein n=1 Tax=Phtheirospermum japonicum TaxID=374723 RepID=A0A830CYP5_9LAMI|nr:hypothetical protein PHJA_002485100 [Phtheirospermum japonicum]